MTYIHPNDRVYALERALAAAQAKNAAPPSPAGQGHALPPVREDQPLRGDEPIGEQHDARIFNRGWNACREAAAALAALQPEPATGKDSLTVGGEPNTAPNRLTDQAKPHLFYIQDTRQVVGNCPMWWGPNGSGYVTRLDEAGRYTEQEAVHQNRTRETDVPWPCAEIDALARKTVDCQHMRPRAERLAELSMLHSQTVQP